jgi:hypothetical protein
MAITLDRPQRRTTYPARQWWGYGVWLFVGAVIATSELWAVVGNPWWPTISATVGHLEQLWSPVNRRWHPLVLIIVAGLSVLVVHLVAYPWP